VPSLAELIDQGIKAFTRGLHADAERAWREALALDPGNERVRGYLSQIAPPQPGADPAAPEGASPRRAGPGAAAPAAPAPGSAPAWKAAQPAVAVQEFAPSPWDDGPALQATIVLESEGGLDLSAIAEKSDIRPLVPDPATTPAPRGAAPKTDVDVWMEGARELFALGDFSGSLEMIEKILKIDPGHAEARAYLRQNESTLVSMYESKLGSLSNVPRLAIKPEEVMWLNLDHRAGFLLAQVDGSVNFEELFALSGLPRLDTAKILAQLLTDGVIRGGAQ
jgi:tetratricopeptide (TPR) repeat protein